MDRFSFTPPDNPLVLGEFQLSSAEGIKLYDGEHKVSLINL